MYTSITTFQLKFELAPIIFKAGIANDPINGQLITDFTQGASPGDIAYVDYFAHFKVDPGGTLIDYQFAEYPFASLEVAANAVIQQPLKINMLMLCPAQTSPTNNYNTKLAQITVLQQIIQQHIQAGGYFTVATPAFIYENVLLKTLRDVTPVSDRQVQYMWQWEFEQPLIALDDANSNLSTLLSGVDSGRVTTMTSLNNNRAGG